MNYLKNNHDISLSKWGPYTKKYMGISHIVNEDRGIRFDLSVFSAFYRGRTDVPNVLWESGYHMWEASADLSYFSYRQQLEWKDKLYTDISFSKVEEDTYLICCECANKTDTTQNIVINYMAGIAFPGKMWESFHELKLWEVKMPDEGIWTDAVDYCSLRYKAPRPTDTLVADGYRRAETVDDGFTGKSGIGCGFGKDKGDCVSYNINSANTIHSAKLIVRYRCAKEYTAVFNINISDAKINLPGTDGFSTAAIDIGSLNSGEHKIIFTSEGTAPIELDGFAIINSEGTVDFIPVSNNHIPESLDKEPENSVIIKYDCSDEYYGIMWDYPDYEVREILNSELDIFMRYNTHDHVHSVLQGDGKGHFTNAFMRPVKLDAGTAKRIYGIVTVGDKSSVKKTLKKYCQYKDYYKLYLGGKGHTYKFDVTKAGEKYRFSQNLMAATLLTNIVFPIYTKRKYIKHHTPGRWWDCLYTWDSGFIGIGISEIDIKRAIEILNAYLTEEDDEQCAFIHHGSMVPVQFYLFLEIMNKTNDKELLEFFYPRLKKYYDFFSGASGSSATRSFKSNILKTWDYFYNSGGWDDYPPQKYVHDNNLEDSVAPVITTAQCIRVAKIMHMAAEELGLNEDILSYKNDIDIFTKSLFTHSWDNQSGYFGYVRHDEEGNPIGILRYDEENYNMGLDGLYPLAAGICDATIQEKIINKLFDKKRLFTDIGITTVDMGAPYYKKDGYWNGAVWMAHQWFFWKTMLDIGRGDLAYKIAERGLKIWKSEAEKTYNCWEHFMVDSQRGAGWHQFGGLSSPVVSWYMSYYGTGNFTTGFDAWVLSKSSSKDNSEMEIQLKIYKNNTDVAFIAVMNPEYSYRVFCNNQEAAVEAYSPGLLNITINTAEKECNIIITKIKQ